MANDNPGMGDYAGGGSRQRHDAYPKVGLAGLMDSIGRAVSHAAQVLGFGRSEPSPYIICEKDVDGRVRGQYIHAGILFVVTLIFLEAMVGEIGRPVAMAVSLVLACLHARWGVRHVLKGQRERRLANLMSCMAGCLGRRERVSLTELAELVEVSTDDLNSLLGEAIDRGLIPEGRLDAPLGTVTLYLTGAAWEADHALEEAREAEERAHEEGAARQRTDELPKDAAKVVDACLSFSIETLETRKRITDDEVGRSLEGIVAKVRWLASYVERHPEAASQMRKLVSYYLPTTAKLASSYAELQEAGDGPEAVSTRAEIKETLVLVDTALDRLSDNLLQDQSWDLRSDMDVMRTMLEQDGLSDSDAMSD